MGKTFGRGHIEIVKSKDCFDVLDTDEVIQRSSVGSSDVKYFAPR